MKLVQFYDPGRGTGVGVLKGSTVIDLTGDGEVGSINDLLNIAMTARMSLTELAGRMIKDDAEEYAYDLLDCEPDAGVAHLVMPVFPPEVWGFGVTYKRSAQIRDEDSHQSIYDRVYHSPRPEAFFKATASRCAGPNAPIGIRSDSTLTATEPELAYMLGVDGEIVGFTLCNDVSAWDLERENPLYLTQSKIFTGCCAIGPMLVTPDEIPDPYGIEITCRILRGETVVYEGSANTSQLARKLDELNEYLYRHNPIPPGTVVSTGTGIMVPNDRCLMHGDIVEISAPKLGVLRNPALQL